MIFVFLHPSEISAKSLAADFGFPFSWTVCDLTEIIEEVLAEIQNHNSSLQVLINYKYEQGLERGKEKKESNTIFQIK